MLILYVHLVVINICIFLAFSYVSYILFKDSTFEQFTKTFVEFTTFKSSGVILSWYDSSVLMSAVGLYATFGPTLDAKGKDKDLIPYFDKPNYNYYDQDYNNLSGELLYISDNACNRSKLFEEINRKLKGNLMNDTIILNERGGCSFYSKVKNFQQFPNIKAVIIGNNIKEQNLLVMKTDQITSKVIIPSFFVSKESLERIKKAVDNKTKKLPNINVRNTRTPPMFELVALMYLPLILALMIIFAIVVSLCKFQPTILSKVYIYKKKFLIPKHSISYHLNNTIKNSTNNTLNFDIKNLRKCLYNLFCKTDSSYMELNDYSSTSFQTHSDNDSEISSNLSVELADLKVRPTLGKTIGSFLCSFKIFQSVEVPNKFRTQRCAICLEKFRSLKSCVAVLSCNHVFHYDCCSKWLKINYYCPICQSRVSSY